MRRRRPCFHLIAGPNGAGKTTFARTFLPRYAGAFSFLNADLIAAGLSPLRPEAAAIAAGRVLVQEWRRLSRAKVSFAAESTLAGVGLIPRLKALRRDGYRLSLYFLWLPTITLARARVRDRVRSGGHNVPAWVIARRFRSGLACLRDCSSYFDEAWVFDNSALEPRLIARGSVGQWQVEDPATWRKVCRSW